MPSWGELLQQVQSLQGSPTPLSIDDLRLKALQRMYELTGRPVVSYSTAFLDPVRAGIPMTAISLTDMQGLMEVFKGVPGPNLDLVLHSPGGEAEATDSLVRYMRSRFSSVRVFVPLAAMSAATIWAMAADEIVMGKHSQLGPIDPQIMLPGSGIQVPAGALLEQFESAVEECSSDPGRVGGWLPTLQQYPPGLLNVCKSASELSKALVKKWLATYMFPQDDAKASAIAEWLADDKIHLSHGRAIRREDLVERGVKVLELEADEDLQDAVLTVHHLCMLTFTMSPALKIIENNVGSRFIIQGQIVQPVHPPQALVMPEQPSLD